MWNIFLLWHCFWFILDVILDMIEFSSLWQVHHDFSLIIFQWGKQNCWLRRRKSWSGVKGSPSLRNIASYLKHLTDVLLKVIEELFFFFSERRESMNSPNNNILGNQRGASSQEVKRKVVSFPTEFDPVNRNLLMILLFSMKREWNPN